MNNNTERRTPLSKDAILLIRGLIVGEVLSIAIIGGLWLWLRPRLQVGNTVSSSSQISGTVSTPTHSTFKTVSSVPIGTFNYGGSTAWAPIRLVVDSQLQNARPELQLRYVNPTYGSAGSGAGIRMLLSGQLDFTQSSRPLTVEERAAARRQGFTLEQRQVGVDGIAVVVNPSLKVPGLTITQLQQIYLGQITNWNQVGGPNLPIVPLSQHPENADVELLPEQPGLQRQVPSANVRYVYSTTEALRRLSQTPGGIYYASAAAVVPQCYVKPLPLGLTSTRLIAPYHGSLVSPGQCPSKRNQLNTEVLKNGSYPLTTRLSVVIKQNKGREQQAGEAYARLLLTNQGQKEIEQAGFAPIHSHL
ncbi:MAG: substrate-binding domain-containing protein [Chroococcidiopsidaceae cyanobacterium CP_BM_ER_R8_30]|nr:substrate-binding domain-containing protein [Chroococcidiopsidaceae cyanobacterium CP_BM_ER_R8_30]